MMKKALMTAYGAIKELGVHADVGRNVFQSKKLLSVALYGRKLIKPIALDAHEWQEAAGK